jgi:hypothetical protein
MFLKRVFYASASILMLALAYHLGAQSASAQAPGNPIVGDAGSGAVVTANGDVYVIPAVGTASFSHWVLAGNVFSSGPVPAQPQTMGQMKARYRIEGGSASQVRR